MDQLYNVWNSVQPLLPPPSSSRSLNQFSTPRFDTFTPLHPVNADLNPVGNASSALLPPPSTLQQQPNQSNKNQNMSAPPNNVTAASSGSSKVKEQSGPPPGHVRRSRHECMICYKPFSNKYNLERHMPLHDEKQKLWKCKTCLRAYTTETIFHSHKRVHHKNDEPSTISFEVVYELRKEVPPGKWGRKLTSECPVCFKKLSNRYNLERHMNVHEEKQMRYKCKSCERAYSTLSAFNLHKNKYHTAVHPSTVEFEVMYEDRKENPRKSGQSASDRRCSNYHVEQHNKTKPWS
ncbi:zinc finger protein SNAI2-like isoform X2 [Contarinia nasturtii]|uniref:zinc finger protein SNAI2-like isoform X2 n=1 Tax=Contarinia nasturtii TaxID=265458 RepID=UPI0012D401EE|nr:zinc finger protein SNAI2-like isoform X2 [Contarinia nasturtii]